MSHTLTETATFTPTVTVPDDTDSALHRGQDVATAAQALANRTRALKAVTDVAAVKNASNTFTAPQTMSAGLTASAATVSGAITANGGIQAADGSVELNGDVSVSGTLQVADTLTANGAAYFNTTHIFLQESVDIVYPTFPGYAQPQRLVQLDISRAKPVAGAPVYDYVPGCWYAPPGGGVCRLEVPILLPRVTAQWSFQIVWSSPSAPAANTAEVWKWARDYSVTGYNAQSDGSIEGVTLTQTSYDTTIGNAEVSAGPVITTEFDPTVERWAVIVKLMDGSNNRFYGLRLQFWDPGARNG